MSNTAGDQKERTEPRRGEGRRWSFRAAAMLDGLLRDFRWACRQILRRPAFALLIGLTLAVGIGPNVAIFSVLKALVLQPFYYPEPDRLVQVWETDIAGRWNEPFTAPDYYDLRAQSTSFKELGVYSTQAYNLSDADAVRVLGVACTAGVLRAYGVLPARGRLFTDEEEEKGRNRVVIISDRLWRERYGADPGIVGRKVRVNAAEHVVVGVMPPGFQFSSPWFRGHPFEIWTPIELIRDEEQRESHWLLAIGRLRDGVDWRSAETEIRSIAAQLAKAHPKTNLRTTMWILPFAVAILGQHIGNLFILAVTVGFVLLVACANVAGMLLAKGAGRQTEMALRSALGAGRLLIIRQMLAESLLLALLGGIAGVLLAFWSIDLLRNFIPNTLPGREEIGIDMPVLKYAMGTSLVTALLFGLAPALTVSKTHIVDALKEGSGSRGATKSRNRLLRFLAVAQIAIAVFLANGAIMMFTSYRNILRIPQVFDTERVLTAEIWLWGPEYEEKGQRAAFADLLVERIQTLPGVRHAALTSKLPLEGGTNREIIAEGEDYDSQIRRPLTETSWATSDYFAAMGIPLLAGRTPNRTDETASERFAVVNRALAERCWPGQAAIGKRIRANSRTSGWSVMVVGVVENVRQWGASQRPLPEVYEPYRANPMVRVNLVVRAHVDPLTLVPAIRQEVARLDRDLPVSDFRTMGEVLERATRNMRFLTLLLDLFTAMAVLLAIGGIYGFVSYQVAQRIHEMGIRIALGATSGSLVMLIFRHTLKLVILGAALGVGLTVNAAFISRRLIYGISPLNPLYLAGGVLLIVLIALVGSIVPAIRGSRVDPVQALRTE